MACCDAPASGPEGVVGCAFGVAAVEAFDRVPFVGVGVVAAAESVVLASSAAVEIAGVEGDDVVWEERLAIAARGSGTAPGSRQLVASVGAVAAVVVGAFAAEWPVVVVGTFD